MRLAACVLCAVKSETVERRVSCVQSRVRLKRACVLCVVQSETVQRRVLCAVQSETSGMCVV